jgi:hypothetical protein
VWNATLCWVWAWLHLYWSHWSNAAPLPILATLHAHVERLFISTLPDGASSRPRRTRFRRGYGEADACTARGPVGALHAQRSVPRLSQRPNLAPALKRRGSS